MATAILSASGRSKNLVAAFQPASITALVDTGVDHHQEARVLASPSNLNRRVLILEIDHGNAHLTVDRHPPSMAVVAGDRQPSRT